jgi:hypothetical protein
MRLAGRLCAGLLLLGAGSAWADDISILSTSYDASTHRASAVVAPRTSSGMVADLNAGDFRVFYDKKFVPRFEISRTPIKRNPVSLVLAIDVSAGMVSKLGNIRVGIYQILERLTPQDEVALVTFDAESRTLSEFGLPVASVKKTLSEIRGVSAPGAVLFNAFKRSEDVAQTGTKPWKAIVILTDGGDSGSALTLDNVVDIVKSHKTNVKVYCIGVGASPAKKSLTQIALMGDGAYIAAKTPADISRAYDSVFNQFSDRYTISFPATEDGAAHTIGVTWQTAGGLNRTTATLISGAKPVGWILPSALGALLVLSLGGAFVMIRRSKGAKENDEQIQPEPALGFDLGPINEPNIGIFAAQPASDEPFNFPSHGQQAPVPDRPTLVKGVPEIPVLAWLVGVSGRDSGRNYQIHQSEVVIGRAVDASIRLDDDEVSRRHAKILRNERGQYIVVDMASSNGVFINGQKVTNSTIADGDQIQIGLTTFTFKTIEQKEEMNAKH